VEIFNVQAAHTIEQRGRVTAALLPGRWNVIALAQGYCALTFVGGFGFGPEVGSAILVREMIRLSYQVYAVG
jgi:hypothetical protein